MLRNARNWSFTFCMPYMFTDPVLKVSLSPTQACNLICLVANISRDQITSILSESTTTIFSLIVSLVFCVTRNTGYSKVGQSCSLSSE